MFRIVEICMPQWKGGVFGIIEIKIFVCTVNAYYWMFFVIAVIIFKYSNVYLFLTNFIHKQFLEK